MAYTVFNETKPDPTVETCIQVFDSTRENLMAVRDAIISTGFFPGWDAELQNSDGSLATDPAQPEQAVFSKGNERIKLRFIWGSVGGEAGNVTQLIAEYSADSGAIYEPMGSTGYPSGTMTLSYDATGNYLRHIWS